MNVVSKVRWLILVVIVVTAVLWPGVALAQPSMPPQPARDGLVIRFSPNSYPYLVNAGEDNVFYLEVENDSTQDIANIRLHADAPRGWMIEIAPENMGLLAPGKVRTFDATVRPPARADKGNYQITFVAEGEGKRGVLTTSVRVERSSSVWLWVGIGIGIAVVAGFILVFLRTRRQ